MIQKILLLGTGGFIGSNLRYWISYYLNNNYKAIIPLGTLFVNVIGCLILGVLMQYSHLTKSISYEARLFISTGLLGALTTFSTFSYETVYLINIGNYKSALFNLGLNILIGFSAVIAGINLVKKII